jgi:hypothetical protein
VPRSGIGLNELLGRNYPASHLLVTAKANALAKQMQKPIVLAALSLLSGASADKERQNVPATSAPRPIPRRTVPQMKSTRKNLAARATERSLPFRLDIRPNT